MERYELLKDLPTAKAGEIFILSNGHLERQQEDSDGGHEILYDRYYVEKYGLLDPSKRWFRKVVKEAHWDYGFNSAERKFHLEIIFPTVEEAREAFDKCDAWKRLKKDLVYLHWQPEHEGEFSIWGKCASGGILKDDVVLDNHREDLDLLFCTEG